jgi:hypothetical protein
MLGRWALSGECRRRPFQLFARPSPALVSNSAARPASVKEWTPAACETREPIFNRTSWRVRLQLLRERKAVFPKTSSRRLRTRRSCGRNCRRSRELRRAPHPQPLSNPIREGSYRQGDHVAHPAVEGLQESFRPEEGKGQGTMVFICEGQSAAGSITSCRDVNNQAVFVLKGKPTVLKPARHRFMVSPLRMESEVCRAWLWRRRH